MTKCSPAFFTYFGGPSLKRNTHLMSWIPKTGADNMAANVRTFVSGVLRGRQDVPNTFQVKLLLPHMKFHQVLVTMELSTAAGRDGDSGLFPVKIRCSAIHFQRKKRVSSVVMTRRLGDDRPRGSSHGLTQSL
mmetsp:Transcript_65922/g.193299  ORF Transcript_65922/g.193299 Transcript_65922/m.193299 type:complete len:133 (-) Transcript_65922:93-491(-)